MKRSEYVAAAAEFRSRLLAEGAKPRRDQEWPEAHEWLSASGTSTCTTPTCVVFGRAFPVTLHENADGIYRALCGRCGTSIVPVLNLEDD